MQMDTEIYTCAQLITKIYSDAHRVAMGACMCACVYACMFVCFRKNKAGLEKYNKSATHPLQITKTFPCH